MSANRGNAARHAKDNSPGAWRSWKGISRPGRAIKFIETYCRNPKGEGHGKPMKLAEFQKSWLEEALADGVDSAILPSPRGNGKSSFGGAVGVWATFDEDETGAPSVPIVATTIGQAIRSVYGVAASMVRNEPELANRSIEFTGIATPRIYVPRNEGTMYPISNDIDGLQGLDPSFAVVDELGFQDTEVWSALILASGKRSRSLIWGTGTPGLDRDNALWLIREKVMAGRIPTGMVYREYAADPGCDVFDKEQWYLANPALAAGFLRESALVTALDTVPESHFRVFRLGQWVDGVESWLGADGRSIWRALESSHRLQDGVASWIGVDVGIKRDSTAVAIVQRQPDGKLYGEVRLWIPTADEPVDIRAVMDYLRIVSKQYQVGAISYDPRFFDVPAKDLYDEGLPMVEIPQSTERMTGIVGNLYEYIKAGKFTHNADKTVEQQVLNAIARPNERGFTLWKGKSRGRIDACIALALAVDRADHAAKPRPKLFIG